MAIWSKQTPAKSANMISATGRSPAHRGADRAADDRLLGDRRVEHALGAEALEQPVGRLERAAGGGDVLAEQEHVVVGLERVGHAPAVIASR